MLVSRFGEALLELPWCFQPISLQKVQLIETRNDTQLNCNPELYKGCKLAATAIAGSILEVMARGFDSGANCISRLKSWKQRRFLGRVLLYVKLPAFLHTCFTLAVLWVSGELIFHWGIIESPGAGWSNASEEAWRVWTACCFSQHDYIMIII